MNAKLLGVLFIAAAMALGTTTAGASFFSDRNYRGGFVKPCSLDGVNPVYHPDIFGNPAVARSFGFIRSRDGAWQVIPNCEIR